MCCSFQKLLYEHYRYGWNITDNCSPVYIKEPADNAYLRKYITDNSDTNSM